MTDIQDQTTASARARTAPPRRRGWRTVDLVTTAMIGVAFGVAFIGWGALGNLLQPLFVALAPTQGVMYAFYWVPAVVAALVVRRPGAALLAELIAASVELLLGSQWGLSTLAPGAIQGLGVELGFLIFAYRRWTLAPAILGGVIAALLETPYEWATYYQEWNFSYIAIYGVAMAISGVLLAGVLGWVIVRGLAKTGALAPFPAGRERLEARRR